jgi:hypothetical protein
MVGWIALSGAPAGGEDELSSGFERLEAGSLLNEASTTHWTIVTATSTASPATPETGLIDFAYRGNPLLDQARVSANPIQGVSSEAPLWDGALFTDSEGKPVPTFWTAPSPATFALTFKAPVELRYVDLVPPSRKHGFADFMVLVRNGKGGGWHDVEIREATVSAGATPDAGFHWRLAIEPERAAEVSVLFRRGSLYLSRQIFLQDLDLWGTPIGKEENENASPSAEPN